MWLELHRQKVLLTLPILHSPSLELEAVQRGKVWVHRTEMLTQDCCLTLAQDREGTEMGSPSSK